MIKTFNHKGLKKFFEQGPIAGINPDHESKLKVILACIDRAKYIKDINLPGYRLHQLKVDKKDL